MTNDELTDLRKAANRIGELTEALQDMVVAFGGGGVTESQSDRVQALNRACQILKEKNTTNNISELKNERRIRSPISGKIS